MATALEEEKKSSEADSQKGDVESADLTEMIGDVNEHTIESLLGDTTRQSQVDDDSYLNDPNAPLRLAVLGPQDDMSTIAGDTITGGSVMTVAAVVSNANLPTSINARKPVQRDFGEYNMETPTKKKGWSPYTNQKKEDDERTQPETPPGIHVVGFPGRDDESMGKDGESTWASYVGPSRRLYLIAAVVAAVLIVLIGGLAIAFIQVGNDDDETSSSASVNREQSTNGGFSPEELAALTNPPVVDEPQIEIEVEIDPTPSPTLSPTTPAFQLELETFVEILTDNGVDTTLILDDNQSTQASAARWIIEDPNYLTYTEPRLIQRYALAVFAFGLSENQARVNSRSATLSFPNVLSYEVSECDWFLPANVLSVCNGFGYLETLTLADKLISGTIPSEIGLLARSLRVFQLFSNNFTGTIPTEFGRLNQLEILGLARNSLSGTVPSEIGQLQALNRLILRDNQLIGELPIELGSLDSLVVMDVSNNNLNGNVPGELANIDTLQSLDFGLNNLSGRLPGQICNLPLLGSLNADCHLMTCQCCTDCTPTAAPTNNPTNLITPAPTAEATPSPTRNPTQEPTMNPTACRSEIDWVQNCIDIGESFDVSFQNCDTQFGDWIGIWERDSDPSNLDTPFLWAWTCGSQTCRGSPATGVIRFNENSVSEPGNWPLRRGDYHAYLVRNIGPPYEAILETERRRIRDDDC